MTNLEITKAYIGSTWVTHMYLGDELVWGGEPGPDYSAMYLTIEALEDGDLTVSIVCEYSINGGEWVSASNPTTISVLNGDTIRFKSNVNAADNMFQNNTLAFNVYGNIMSLKYGDNFKGQTTVIPLGMFFQNSTGLKSAENLVIPATTLTQSCYSAMFAGCTSLTKAPKLPATALANYCYQDMFSNCTSLTTAPVLQATTLAERCYNQMFANCVSLTTAPELPATALANNCYMGMFNACTSLTTAPSILPATTLTDNCYNTMFYGCTGLTTAPELPATTLAVRCYYSMFRGCSSLNYIKCLATDISATNCTYRWVNGVARTGTFVKDANMSSWTTGNNGIPTGWTVQDADI